MAVPAQMLEAAQWAADQFGGGIQRRNAFVAWWACEDGYKWPTNSRNNPGNMRPGGTYRGVVGVTPRVGPLGGFFVFDTPADGVAAMVQAIETSVHYPGIRAALAGGNAQAIAKAVGASPWGTNSPCMLSALKAIPSTATPTGTGWQTVNRQAGVASTGGSGVTLASAPAPAATAPLQIPLRQIFVTAYHLPPTYILDQYYASQWVEGMVEQYGSVGGALLNPQTIEGQDAVSQAALQAAIKPYIGQAVGNLPASISVSVAAPNADPVTAVAQAIAALPDTLGNIAIHLGQGLVIAVLIVLGLYVLVTADEEG